MHAKYLGYLNSVPFFIHELDLNIVEPVIQKTRLKLHTCLGRVEGNCELAGSRFNGLTSTLELS